MTEYDKLRNALDEVYFWKRSFHIEDRVGDHELQIDILREVLAKVVDRMEAHDSE